MTMTENDRRMRETVIEFASCLYGGAWRDRLAEVSGTPKRTVGDWFRGDKALPRALPLAMLRAMENDAIAQIAEKEALRDRVKALRMELVSKSADAPAEKTNTASAEAEKTANSPRPAAAAFPSRKAANAESAVANELSATVRQAEPEAEAETQPNPTVKRLSARRIKRRGLRLVASRNG